MSAQVESIVSKLRDGELSPEEALDAFETPAKNLADIGVDLDTTPLNCGFPSLERLAFLRQGKPDLAIVAARPGVGKTSLACQLGLTVSKHSNVLMYSIEMAAKQISTRMICVEAGKSIKKLNERANRSAILAAQELFRKCSFSIDDTNAIDVETLVIRTLDYHRKRPLSLVLVDYIQIIKVAGGRSKAEEVNLVCEKLKSLANMIGCPILAVAQMNRQFDSRVMEDPSARPVMSDLADSAGIEKWADMIACLHKPDPNRVRVFLLKNRHGESQDFDLGFTGAQTKFYEPEEGL